MRSMRLRRSPAASLRADRALLRPRGGSSPKHRPLLSPPPPSRPVRVVMYLPRSHLSLLSPFLPTLSFSCSYARSVAALREAAQPNYTYQPKFPKFISSPTSVQRMFAIAEAAKPKDEDLAHATRKAAHLRRSAPPVTFERTSMLGASRPAGGEMATELMRQMRLMTVRGGPPDHAKKARAAMASAYSAIQKEKHVPDEMKLRILKRELAVAGANHALDLRSHQLQQHTKKHGVVESRRQVSRAHREPDRRTPCACCSFPFAEKNLHMQVTCKAIVGVQRSWPLHVPVDPKYAEPPRCYDLRWVCAMCAQFFEQAVVESSASPEANPATKTAANSSSAGSTKRHGSLSSKSRLLRLSGRGDQWWLRDGIELGSTVDHKSHGEGTVIRINPDGDQRVHVEFGIGEIHRYKEIAWAKFRMPSDTVNDVTEAGKTKRLGTKSSSPKGGSPTSAELGAAARQGGGSSSSSSSSSSRRRRMEKTRKRAPKGYVKPSERAAKALERRRRGMRRLAASVLGSPLETDDPYE